MALVDSAVAFLVSWAIGALAIYLGAAVILEGDRSYVNALIAALVGAIVWAGVTLVVGWIPLLGPLLALIAWIAVINWRYPGGWLNAALIGVIAWLAALLIVFLLVQVDLIASEALGVPGT